MERPNITRSNLLQVLSIRPFLFLWIAQLISQMAFNMLIFVLGLFIYERTRSNTAVSVLFFTAGVPAALCGIFAGVYVDRLNKKRVLLVTTVVRIFLVALIVITNFNLFFLYPLIIIISAVSQFFIPAEASLIPRLVPQSLLLPANSLFTITFYTAIIGGFVVGGPLLAHIGDTGVIIVLLILFVITAVFISLLPGAEKIPLARSFTWKNMQADLQGGIGFIINSTRVRQAMMLMTMAQVVISIFLTLGPGFADHILHIQVTDASLIILGPAAAGMIVGAFITGMIGSRFKKRQLINFGLTCSGALLVLVALLVQLRNYGFMNRLFYIHETLLPISVVCFLLLGLANSLIDIACNTVIQESTPDHIRGRVYGILSSAISGVALLPVVISGIIADTIGVGKMIFLLGIMLLSLSLYTSGIFKSTPNLKPPQS